MQKTVNDELKKVNVWFMVNGLSLNVKKTNFIIFCNKKKQTKLDLKINNVSIDRVQCTKFLGVYVDEMLNWDFHLNIIQKKISKCIGILHRVKYKLGKI